MEATGLRLLDNPARQPPHTTGLWPYINDSGLMAICQYLGNWLNSSILVQMFHFSHFSDSTKVKHHFDFSEVTAFELPRQKDRKVGIDYVDSRNPWDPGHFCLSSPLPKRERGG